MQDERTASGETSRSPYRSGHRAVLGVVAVALLLGSAEAQALEWTSSADFPRPNLQAATLSLQGRLYVCGGSFTFVTGDEYSTTWMADIHGDGSLGPWWTAGDLNVARTLATGEVYGDTAYVCLGLSAIGARRSVEYATPGPDGSMNWVRQNNVFNPRYGHCSWVYRGRLYVAGGWGVRGVESAPILPDRSLGPRRPETILPQWRYTANAVVIDDYVYLIGGYKTSPNVLFTSILRSRIGTDGVLGAWEDAGELPVTVTFGRGFAFEDRAVILGDGEIWLGERGAPSGEPTLELWSDLGPGPPLLGARFSAALAGSFLYVIAGYDVLRTDLTEMYPPPLVYCTAKTSSAGCLPSVWFAGSPALSGSDDFHVLADYVLEGQPGVLLWGRAPNNAPFLGGTLCVGGSVARTAPQLPGGAGPCGGVFSTHLSGAYLTSQGLGAGDSVYAQYWSRDPGFVPPGDVGLTDAIRFTIQP